MILKESKNRENILFDPEGIKERSFLENFPGLLREGLVFYAPFKYNVVYNLYQRLKKKVPNIRMTPGVSELISQTPALSTIPESFKFHTEPLPHQMIALRYAYTFGSVGLLLEPGLGKTKVVLDFMYLKGFKKNIIVCPLALTEVWRKETKKHRPELTTYVVQSTDWEKEKEAWVKSKAEILVINYDKCVAFGEVLRAEKFDFIAVDEGLIKNYNTDRTIAITALGYSIPYRMIMSGTLINNSPLDTFSPVRFIEPSLFGQRVTPWKKRYAHLSRKNPNIILGFLDIPEIKSVLASCSIVMTKKEWLKDLPDKVFNRRISLMSDSQIECYKQLASNYICKLPNGEMLEVDNALTLMMKLYQIANGFIYWKEEEDDSLDELMAKYDKKKAKAKRHVYRFEEQPKMAEFKKLRDDPAALKNKRAIIWFNLGEECEIIQETLDALGDNYLTIRGGDKKLADKVEAFNTDSSIRWLVCQSKTLNYGQTIMGHEQDDSDDKVYVMEELDSSVADEVFYSINFSLEMFLQQQDRIHRIGQKNVCNYWILLTNSSVERRTFDAIDEKLVCNRTMLEDIASSAKYDFS